MENNDFQNNMRKLIYEEFQSRLGEQMQPKEDIPQDEFDYAVPDGIVAERLDSAGYSIAQAMDTDGGSVLLAEGICWIAY